MPFFKIKPKVVEAVQFNGSNQDEIIAFAGKGSAITINRRDAIFIPMKNCMNLILKNTQFLIKESDGSFINYDEDDFVTLFESV